MIKLRFIFSLLLLDQATKYLTLGIHKEIFSFFFINSVHNSGTLFGLFQNTNFILIVLTFLILSILFYFYNKEPSLQQGFNFIIAGALGNLLDRVYRGYVLDFLDFKLWPIFNLADSFVVLGVFFCVYSTFKKESLNTSSP